MAPSSDGPRRVGRGARIFRTLLRLLPLDFRSVHGREMQQVFEAQRHERRQDGLPGVLRLWAEAALDILRTAPREHLAMLRQDVASRCTRKSRCPSPRRRSAR
jgi:hypothetical protein